MHFCPVCNKELKETQNSLAHHLVIHKEYIEKLKNKILYLKVKGYKLQDIHEMSKNPFTHSFLVKTFKNNKQLLQELEEELIEDLISRFKNGDSIIEISKDYSYGTKKILSLIKTKLSSEEINKISREIKNKKISKRLNEVNKENERNSSLLVCDIKSKTEFYISHKKNIYYYKNCEYCLKKFEHTNRKRQCCSRECGFKLANRKRGLKSVTSQNKRSKNEIHFSNLCEKEFKNILCNDPIFNGWDADIILPDLKIAILWNGPWHYIKLTKDHKLLQVQNRDKIKIKEIKKSGYLPYIIKDMGRENKDFVELEFEKFINFLKKERIN